MNHKILASLVSLNLACPMALLGWTELENAEADGAKMKMTFVVVDNDNNVVTRTGSDPFGGVGSGGVAWVML